MKTARSYIDLENLNDDLGFLVLQMSNLWEQNHKKVLKRYHITHTEFCVLASIHWLSEHDNLSTTQIGLAKHIKTDPMNISQTIKGLEKQKLVLRTCHPMDVRANLVLLTSEGKEIIEKAALTIHEAERRFFQILGRNYNYFRDCMIKLIQSNE
ncbi:MarR family transcriptional regulator [Bacteroidia bacterium]|nr:MarR family transcriptional regulator [Bacteroidia bacterium]